MFKFKSTFLLKPLFYISKILYKNLMRDIIYDQIENKNSKIDDNILEILDELFCFKKV